MSFLFRNKSILVTGGTGFIGQHLVISLLAQGANVTVLSRLSSNSRNQHFVTIEGDLANPASLTGICRGMDIVFHLAGHTHDLHRAEAKNDEVHRRVTVEGTRALMEQCIKNNIGHFIHFSSVKAMGEGSDTELNESDDAKPQSAYGRAKLESEKIVLEAHQNGLPATIIRLPMVYGPGCKGNLPRMIQSIERRYFPPFPNTLNKRSMVDVRDVVQAALLAAMSPIAAGKLYIVTDGKVYSTREIYECICKELQITIPSWTVPVFVLHIAAKMGDFIGLIKGTRFVFDSSALDKLLGSAWYSSEKISRDLKYRPTYSLSDALPEIVTEHRRQT